MHPFYLLQVLYARRKIFLMMLGLAMLVAVSVLLLLPKTYKATAQGLLDMRGTDPIAGVTGPGYLSPGYLSTYIATQEDIVKSHHTALRVVDALGLAQDPAAIKRFHKKNEGK